MSFFSRVFSWLSLRARYIPAVLLVGLGILISLHQLLSLTYDGDLDHFMYAGSRLLRGELMWEVEFDDKLPLLAFLFALPAASGSLRTWMALSLLFSVAASVIVYRFLNRSLARAVDDHSARKAIAGTAAAWMFYGYSATVWTGHGHMNIAASCLLVFVIPLIERGRSSRASLDALRFVAASVLLAIAVSMRPYLLPVVFCYGAWLWWSARPSQSTTTVGRFAALRWPTFLLVGTAAAFLLLNLLPYLAAGHGEVAARGLKVLAQDLVPQKPLLTVSEQISFVRGLPLLCGAGLILAGAGALWLLTAPRSPERPVGDWLFLGVLPPIGIELMVIAKHWWPHYGQLFVPFIALGIGYTLAEAYRHRLFSLSQSQQLTFALTFVLVGLFASNLPVGGRIKDMTEGMRSEFGNDLEVVQQVIDDAPEGRRSFLAPGDMRLHWRLGEGRHGFPHAANTGYIMKGYWTDLEVPDGGFIIPLNTSQYCERLLTAELDFIIEDKDTSWVAECLSRERATYEEVARWEPTTNADSRIVVYRHRR